MDKLLHERLREHSDDFPHFTCADHRLVNISRKGAQRIADEIERSYIPREQHESEVKEAVMTTQKPLKWFRKSAQMGEYPEPREGEGMKAYLDRRFLLRPCDPEGNPWGVGQQCDFGTITALCWKGDEWLAEVNGSILLHNTKSINRPVLDADGVEIKAGDTGWQNYNNHLPRTIKKVHPAGTWPQPNPRCNAWVTYESGSWDWAENFTHKEPDTLAKLRDDIKSCNGDFEEWASRLTAIMERGA